MGFGARQVLGDQQQLPVRLFTTRRLAEHLRRRNDERHVGQARCHHRWNFDRRRGRFSWVHGDELLNQRQQRFNHVLQRFEAWGLIADAGISLTNKGAASQTVDGGGMLTIKGGLVQVN